MRHTFLDSVWRLLPEEIVSSSSLLSINPESHFKCTQSHMLWVNQPPIRGKDNSWLVCSSDLQPGLCCCTPLRHAWTRHHHGVARSGWAVKPRPQHTRTELERDIIPFMLLSCSYKCQPQTTLHHLQTGWVWAAGRAGQVHTETLYWRLTTTSCHSNIHKGHKLEMAHSSNHEVVPLWQ